MLWKLTHLPAIVAAFLMGIRESRSDFTARYRDIDLTLDESYDWGRNVGRYALGLESWRGIEA